MATCKDCIHGKACAEMLKAMGYNVSEDFQGSAERCDTFKNKADFVEAKQGVWIISCDGYYPYCNQCGYEPKYPMDGSDNRTPHCPNCGAKMRKECEKQ